jgi:hypothetical protein
LRSHDAVHAGRHFSGEEYRSEGQDRCVIGWCGHRLSGRWPAVAGDPAGVPQLQHPPQGGGEGTDLLDPPARFGVVWDPYTRHEVGFADGTRTHATGSALPMSNAATRSTSSTPSLLSCMSAHLPGRGNTVDGCSGSLGTDRSGLACSKRQGRTPQAAPSVKLTNGLRHQALATPLTSHPRFSVRKDVPTGDTEN